MRSWRSCACCGYTRRRNILENEANLEEGIRLALHPLIPWERWPGNP